MAGEMEICLWAIGIIIAILIMFILMSGVKIIKQYQLALWEKLGKYQRILKPGWNFVTPFISDVYRIDMRTQTLDVPRQEVITKDNSPTNVDAVIYIRVVDPVKAQYEVQDYHLATVYLAQTTLRSILGDMELDEILYNREKINAKLRDILDEATDQWGVKVEMVEIREVDPVGPVKAAMEEQTASERQRRAAILRADGKKRSAILEAEGRKRSMILRAEGSRQSKVLQAEGDRRARILKAQGEAQRLRIVSLGSATLDQKSLTFLSLDALKDIGDGKATKIIFPLEITRMLEGVAEYVGAGRKIAEHTTSNLEDLESKIGTSKDILGEIPKPSEIRDQLDSIEKETAAVAKTTEKIVTLEKEAKEKAGKDIGKEPEGK